MQSFHTRAYNSAQHGHDITIFDIPAHVQLLRNETPVLLGRIRDENRRLCCSFEAASGNEAVWQANPFGRIHLALPQRSPSHRIVPPPPGRRAHNKPPPRLSPIPSADTSRRVL